MTDPVPKFSEESLTAAAVAGERNKRGRSSVPSENKKEVDEVKGIESVHAHKLSERERRKKLKNMFSGLHAMLPQLPPNADKSAIVDEAVSYINTLQATLQQLQKEKLEKMQQLGCTGSSMEFNLPQTSMAAPEPGFAEHRDLAYTADQVAASKNLEMRFDPSFGAKPQIVPSGFQSWSSPNVILSVNGMDAHISVCATNKPGLLVVILHILEKYMLDVITLQISSHNNICMYMIHAHAKTTSTSTEYQYQVALAMEVFKKAVEEIIMWISSSNV